MPNVAQLSPGPLTVEDPTAVCEMPSSEDESAETPEAYGGAYKERFGRYLLLERLGQGGMAEVFKAVAEGAQGFRRVFVVKRILPQFADSSYFVSLFADEAKLSAMLHHPNLVQVYEFGAVAGTHYLSMEYLEGTDLSSVLSALAKQNLRLAPSITAFIAQQVAHGLAYAHAACDERGTPLRLVHRDVSPENIMLLEAGTVKLFDFGIALSDQRLASSVTQGKVMKGKLAYASPEQVKGHPLDGRSDIFSLGVVMWEMLTCKRLFLGDGDARTLYNVLERPVAPPSEFAPGIPPLLDAVVLRALAREPAARYQTGDELAEDLDKVLRLLTHHRTDLPKLLKHLFEGGRPPARRWASKLPPTPGALPIQGKSITSDTLPHTTRDAAAAPTPRLPRPPAVEETLDASPVMVRAARMKDALYAFARPLATRGRRWLTRRPSREAGAIFALSAAACALILLHEISSRAVEPAMASVRMSDEGKRGPAAISVVEIAPALDGTAEAIVSAEMLSVEVAAPRVSGPDARKEAAAAPAKAQSKRPSPRLQPKRQMALRFSPPPRARQMPTPPAPVRAPFGGIHVDPFVQ